MDLKNFIFMRRSIPSQNVRKPLIFSCFQGVQRENIDLKLVKYFIQQNKLLKFNRAVVHSYQSIKLSVSNLLKTN